MSRRFVNGFLTLFNLTKQKVQPQSERNKELEANRPKNAPYITALKRFPEYEGRVFYSQREMSSLRHSEAVLNGRRKRNVCDRSVDRWDVFGWPSQR